ncbi:MAG TPA: hypothetical protein VFO63_17760 [Blastocatellia bacterium]|nr:hypothetical protein [Blastocatellia bacterium]
MGKHQICADCKGAGVDRVRGIGGLCAAMQTHLAEVAAKAWLEESAKRLGKGLASASKGAHPRFKVRCDYGSVLRPGRLHRALRLIPAP